MCFVFHEWSKWEQYDHQYSFYLGRIAPKEVQGKVLHNVDLRQRRVCLKCGKMQDELVSEGVGLSNNRLHLDVGDSPAQQALFTPEAGSAEGKSPTPAPRR